MSDENDYRRIEKQGAELFQRWQNQHPEAAREMAEMRDGRRAEDLDAWRAKYPEAVAGYGRAVLYSRDCVRKMRMTVPGWEPPQPTDM
jgi:hypothetical protein